MITDRVARKRPPAWAEAAFAPKQPPHSITGDVRIHRGVYSRWLRRARDVLVYLPPGYRDDENRRYPVLYAHDGQNLFDGATSYVPGQEWHLDETAEYLIRAGAIEPLIIVAINHAGEKRVDEFAPTRDPRRRFGGKARLYGRFLVEELKPVIDRAYRTRVEREFTGLCGSSMGGLVTMWLALKHPAIFSRLAVMSPSAWWGQRLIVRDVEALHDHLPLQIWLDIGTSEGRGSLQDVRLLRDALVAKGWRDGSDLRYLEVEGGTHSESAWAARVEPVLRYLFPNR